MLSVYFVRSAELKWLDEACAAHRCHARYRTISISTLRQHSEVGTGVRMIVPDTMVDSLWTYGFSLNPTLLAKSPPFQDLYSRWSAHSIKILAQSVLSMLLSGAR